MDGVAKLRKQFLEYTNSLFQEEILDQQFVQLQQLQDESSPNFVFEVVSLFFEDSKRLLNELEIAITQENIDFKKVDGYVHQLKGSSSSIGAHRVRNACVAFRHHCEAQNIEGCLQCLQQVKTEYFLVKNKLETFFKMEQQLSTASQSGSK
ncbi:putative Histidine-containing phosphotransfer protein [Quillaja saponaria]|uniref:Histidine-containing phosphotransfer protein n=1 Tax=Quillaja saponaria TaxID=32244 RepID=A0AAD7Q223_QUISA|nr:putative Histidine-containing phosphotransfer protein [Quillaja saponaria]